MAPAPKNQKKEKKKNERSDNDDGVGRCREEKKNERYLVDWAYFILV
jgi:hypothetical protein